ncbi:MAG: CDP-glucose 4,6-dehydratase [Elusimicrobia bacterium]|nr:CDP-glucose 4,6-dehydratase [Elusimicrobiota bacterium]
MEVGGRLQEFYRGKRILVTGLSGFKGAWLGLWLHDLGAEVSGLSLKPEGKLNLYRQLGLDGLVDSRYGDIRDLKTIRKALAKAKPQIVFHLAAQSLVRRSYQDPVGTFETNALGTAHVLEACRHARSVKVIQVITSDKCYENNDSGVPFRESDRLGGHDPYSASKACAELAVSSYRDSFFADGISLSSARAGNVIGGGDWAEHRIIPDCARALSKGKAVIVRHPESTRPWQHVLEPLSGYLLLAARQWEEPGKFGSAWNFGPEPGDVAPVREVVERFFKAWGSGRWAQAAANGGREATALRLDSSKAKALLGWKPVYSIDEAVAQTAAWYKAWASDQKFSAACFCRDQIRRYANCTRVQ